MGKRVTKRQRKSGPVRVSYLPGFGPPPPTPTGPDPERLTRTKFPFSATINGRGAIVSRNAYGVQFDYPTERTDDDGATVRPE